jgi:hypothetical protein
LVVNGEYNIYGLASFILILQFFAQQLISLLVAWRFVWGIAGGPSVAKIAVPWTKVAVVLSDVWRSLV